MFVPLGGDSGQRFPQMCILAKENHYTGGRDGSGSFIIRAAGYGQKKQPMIILTDIAIRLMISGNCHCYIIQIFLFHIKLLKSR